MTGAASGMGKQIAIDYAREGAKVVVSDLNLDGANATVEEIKENGGMAFAIKTNVAVEGDIQHLIDTMVSTDGTVDILVNNAVSWMAWNLPGILRILDWIGFLPLTRQASCVRLERFYQSF